MLESPYLITFRLGQKMSYVFPKQVINVMAKSYKKEYRILFPTKSVVTIVYPMHSTLKRNDWNIKIAELIDYLESNHAQIMKNVVNQLIKSSYKQLKGEEKREEKNKITKSVLDSIFFNVSQFGKSIELYLNYDEFLKICVLLDYDSFEIQDACFEE